MKRFEVYINPSQVVKIEVLDAQEPYGFRFVPEKKATWFRKAVPAHYVRTMHGSFWPKYTREEYEARITPPRIVIHLRDGSTVTECCKNYNEARELGQEQASFYGLKHFSNENTYTKP